MDEFIDTPDAELDVTEQLMVSAESALATLQSLHARVLASGAIDKTMANSIRTLTTGMESMDAHFSQHPINSYTMLTSSTNLKATLEGMVSTIAKKVWEAIKAIWKFIVDAVKWVMSIRTRNTAAFKKMQADASRGFNSNKYPLDVVWTTGAIEPKHQALVNEINRNSMAVWLGVGEGKKTAITPGQYGAELFNIEAVLYSDLTERLERFKNALDVGVPSDSIARLTGEDLYCEKAMGVLLGYRTVVPHQSAAAVLDILNREAAEAEHPSSLHFLTSMDRVGEWYGKIRDIRNSLSDNSGVKEKVGNIEAEIKAVKASIERLIDTDGHNGVYMDEVYRARLLLISREISYYSKVITKFESLKSRYFSGVALAFKGQFFDWWK